MMTASIEETIQSVEHLYQSVTGREAPRTNGESYSPIPPEADAVQHVEQQLLKLLQKVQDALGAAQTATWSPPLTIRDDRGERVLELDIPGVLRESVHVVVAGEFLTVTGHRAPPQVDGASGGRLLHDERTHGPFERTIPLPDGVTMQQVTAELSGGVLRIRVPRAGRPEEPLSVPVR